MGGALSDEKSGLYFSVFAGHQQRSLFEVLSPTGLMSICILLSLFLRLPQPGGPGGPVISPGIEF
jgi:hypothetical protein